MPTTDESTSRSSVFVAEHPHQSHQSQRQRQRPPVTPKPSAAVRQQPRRSPAANRDDYADIAAVQPSVTPVHLPSSHSSATQSLVPPSYARPAVSSAGTAKPSCDRPVPPTRRRHHKQRHSIGTDLLSSAPATQRFVH